MNFTLNILDKDGIPLDVSALNIKSQTLALDQATGATVTGLDLQVGSTYRITLDADATTDSATTTSLVFAEDVSLNFTTGVNDLTIGAFYDITPIVAVTGFTFSVLSATDTYDGDLNITGEDITITIDGNVTTGANVATEVIADDDTIDITVVSPGYHTYTNTVRVYDYDVDVGIKLMENITDPLDADFRRPYPYFFFILEPCSYNIHVYNAQSAPFGMISYYHTLDTANTFATTPNGVLDTCVPESLPVTQRIIVREVANCGGTSPVIYDEIFTINPITTTEYKPYVVLERALNCCEPIDNAIVINPQEVNMQNTGIHACDLTTIDPALVYTIVAPDGTETVLSSYNGTEVLAGPLTALGFSFTPTVLGTHTLRIDITNCCVTIQQNYTFDVCNSWVVTNTECNIIKIQNLSLINDISYTLRELSDFDTFDVVEIDDTAQQNIVVPANTEVELDMQIDNLYTVLVEDNNPSTVDIEQIFVLDCNIKKCKKELTRNFLCGEDICDVQTRVENQEKLKEFLVLEKIIYQKWDEWKQQQSTDNTFSINDIMEDVITLSKAIETIGRLCSKCGTDCSTDNRSACSYTISNGGFYIVPIRCASIVVPKDNDNCGCN